MLKALYLNESDGLVVRTDGPSLWIKEAGKAGRRVPVRLVSNVIVRGNVRMDAGAIMLFAESGVPVVFIGKNGVSAAVLNAGVHESILRERIFRTSTHKEGIRRVKEWLTARRRNAVARLLNDIMPFDAVRVAVKTKGFQEKDYLRCIENALPRSAEKRTIHIVEGVIGGLIFDLALKATVDIEVSPHVGFISKHEDFGFIKDLCFALEPEKHRQMIQFFKDNRSNEFFNKERGLPAINGCGMRNITTRFENRKAVVSATLDSLLGEFLNILREPFYEGEISRVL